MNPTTNTVLEGRLNKDQEVFCRTHICATGAEELLRLQQLEIDLKRSHLTGASAKDLENALHIFPPPGQKADSGSPLVETTIALDSSLDPPIAGVRGASAEPIRQFILRDEDYDIHIKIVGDGDRIQVHGQLLPRSGEEFGPPAECHLLLHGARVQSTSTDETGEFHFNGVTDGNLHLQIDLPGLTIVGSLNTQDTH